MHKWQLVQYIRAMNDRIQGVELRYLVAFAKVAKRGSFASAARALGVERSLVSRDVARLEAALGTALFRRTTRRLDLTDEGRVALGAAERILEEAASLSADLENRSGEPSGVLRVTAPVVLGQAVLVDLLPAFRSRHSQVELHLELSDHYVDLIRDGFDVALRAGVVADTSHVARKLARSVEHLYASPSYLDERGEPLNPGDLVQHSIVTTPYTPDGNVSWSLRSSSEKRRLELRPEMTTNDFYVLASTIVQGQGVGRLPMFIAKPFLRRRELAPVLPAWSSDLVDVRALYPRHSVVPRRVRAFVDFIAEALPKQYGFFRLDEG